MLLDRLLKHANLNVAPFAVCDIRSGSNLVLDGGPQARMHFVLHGSGTLAVKADRERLGPYTLVLVPPGIGHTIRSDAQSGEPLSLAPEAIEGVERIVVGEGGTGLVLACGALQVELSAAGLFQRLARPLVQPFEDSPQMKQLFDALLFEQLVARPGRLRMIESIMMQCVVHLLRRLMTGGPSLPWLEALDDPQLRRTLDVILDRPGAPHTLDDLAATAGMSRSSFGTRFSAAFGRSPMAFVKEVRLQLGAKLLRTTDLPIKAIAAKVGYASRSHFSRAFKMQFTRDPQHYRGQHEDDVRSPDAGMTGG